MLFVIINYSPINSSHEKSTKKVGRRKLTERESEGERRKLTERESEGERRKLTERESEGERRKLTERESEGERRKLKLSLTTVM